MALNAALSLGSGIAGIFGAAQQSKQQKAALAAQAAYQKAAAGALQTRTGGMNAALQTAENYDPISESQKAVDYAGSVASDNLTKSLADLNQRFRNGGGDPGGDTAFRVQAQGTANRIADPLKQFAAEQAAQATQQKLSAIEGAVSSGGDIASAYEGLANGAGASAAALQPNYAPGISAFASGLNGLSNKNLWKVR